MKDKVGRRKGGGSLCRSLLVSFSVLCVRASGSVWESHHKHLQAHSFLLVWDGNKIIGFITQTLLKCLKALMTAVKVLKVALTLKLEHRVHSFWFTWSNRLLPFIQNSFSITVKAVLPRHLFAGWCLEVSLPSGTDVSVTAVQRGSIFSQNPWRDYHRHSAFLWRTQRGWAHLIGPLTPGTQWQGWHRRGLCLCLYLFGCQVISSHS